jgi:hypothetical protein
MMDKIQKLSKLKCDLPFSGPVRTDLYNQYGPSILIMYPSFREFKILVTDLAKILNCVIFIMRFRFQGVFPKTSSLKKGAVIDVSLF